MWCNGERLQAAALRGVPAAYAEYRRSHPSPPDPGHGYRAYLRGEWTSSRSPTCGKRTPIATARRSGAPLSISAAREARLGWRCVKDRTLLGAIFIYRQEVRPFTDKQIALLQNFAAQAVIAMENARLLDEIRQRQAELRVTFDNMADGVAMFDEDLRLAAWNRNFQQIARPARCFLGRASELSPTISAILAERGEFGTDDIEAELSRRLEDTRPGIAPRAHPPDGQVIEVRRNAVPDGGFVLIYQRHHRAQAVRGRNPRRPRRRRSGACAT